MVIFYIMLKFNSDVHVVITGRNPVIGGNCLTFTFDYSVGQLRKKLS